ncbi:MAG: amino acid--tRNA ligase-related protein, partial [Nitrospinota bacterium]|nr:amino acid--tRNA ligase-related protein [Nitrospinota bacterium]
ENKFERIPYSEAIHILGKSDDEFVYSVEWGCSLQSEHERYLTERVFKKPVIVYNYPEDIKPFYMKVNEEDETVRAMDVLVPRLGEIIGGSQREDNYETLTQRLEGKGFNQKDYWWYLELRLFGSAPHSGFGLGFERLIQFVTGMENIRDVIPFPRTPKHAGF